MRETPPADFRIARDGTWFHDGAKIEREALAKLFSDRALIIDAHGDYWLKTPYEQYPVEVEDVPYVIVDYQQNPQLSLITNMDEQTTLCAETLWELRNDIPYVEIRDGLFARLGRGVYYNLIEAYGAQIEVDGKIFPMGADDETG